jgi:hypothetical protein
MCTWAHVQGSNTGAVRTSLQPGDNDEVWCCLQGLTKQLTIESSTGAVPSFFSDRPERFFLPDVRSSQRDANR